MFYLKYATKYKMIPTLLWFVHHFPYETLHINHIQIEI